MGSLLTCNEIEITKIKKKENFLSCSPSLRNTHKDLYFLFVGKVGFPKFIQQTNTPSDASSIHLYKGGKSLMIFFFYMPIVHVDFRSEKRTSVTLQVLVYRKRSWEKWTLAGEKEKRCSVNTLKASSAYTQLLKPKKHIREKENLWKYWDECKIVLFSSYSGSVL